MCEAGGAALTIKSRIEVNLCFSQPVETGPATDLSRTADRLVNATVSRTPSLDMDQRRANGEFISHFGCWGVGDARLGRSSRPRADLLEARRLMPIDLNQDSIMRPTVLNCRLGGEAVI